MFDRVVCLNVDKRLSERGRIDREFAAHGMAVDYFLAGKESPDGVLYDHHDVTTPPPRRGYPWNQRMASYNAFLCFQKIVAAAVRDGVQTLLVCEDDVTLTPEFGTVLPAAWADLQAHDPDWDMLYLGANHTWGRTKEVTPRLLRLLGGTQCWHCVGLSRKVFGTILSLPVESPIDDVCARRVQPVRRCYAVWPSVALQAPGYSHCDNKFQDYTHYFAHKGNP